MLRLALRHPQFATGARRSTRARRDTRPYPCRRTGRLFRRRLRSRFAFTRQDGDCRTKTVDIGVATLQVARAGGRLESSAPVQNPSIVDDEQIAWFEAEADLKSRIGHQTSEQEIGVVPR